MRVFRLLKLLNYLCSRLIWGRLFGPYTHTRPCGQFQDVTKVLQYVGAKNSRLFDYAVLAVRNGDQYFLRRLRPKPRRRANEREGDNRKRQELSAKEVTHKVA